MGGPSAATKAAKDRAAAQTAAAVLAGVTSDAVQAAVPAPRNRAANRAPARPKDLPTAAQAGGDITAAAIGSLRTKDDFTSGAIGFFSNAKATFGEFEYQITLNVVLIGSSPKSPKYDKTHKRTIKLVDAAERVALALPASLMPTVFKTRKSDGFRINGRFTVSPTEAYVLTGTATRIGSGTPKAK